MRDTHRVMAEWKADQHPSRSGDYRPGYLVAADRLLDYVAAQRLAPGARLPTERDLAEILELSRSMVREAIKVLSAVGRLSVQKGRGIYVADAPGALSADHFAHPAPTAPEQIYSLFEVRMTLETMAVGLACERATPAQVRAIAVAADASGVAAAAGDTEQFGAADTRFHQALAAATNNEYLVGIFAGVQRLHHQMGMVALAGTAPGSLTAAADQHRRISDAVQAGDRDLGVTLVLEHIQTAQRQVQSAIRDRIFTE